VFINTSESGKTRLLLEGLCSRWGFYFVAKPDFTGIGSGDFEQVVDTLHEASDYGTAKGRLYQPEATQTAVQPKANPAAVQHIRDMTGRRLHQLLLARFLLLDLLVQEAEKLPQRLDQKVHRRLWVLLQAQPTMLNKQDIFTKLTLLLKYISTSDLKEQIDQYRQRFFDSLPTVRHPVTAECVTPPALCVLDEVQVTVTDPFARMGDFLSDTNAPRPILREIWRSWSRIPGMRLVFSGTGIELRAFQDALTSVALKEYPYRLCYDTGASEDPQIQTKYIARYVPACVDHRSWEAFLTRAYAWLRGR